MTEDDKLRPIRRTLTGVLIFQLVLAAFLFLGDVGRDFTLPNGAPKAPDFDLPTQPGDQTRRFNPSLPAGPGLDTGPMPERLVLDPLEPDDSGGRVLLTGKIEHGDAERIVTQLRATEAKTIVVHSPGGSVLDALTIGRAIRKAGLNTTLRESDVCVSACPYMFAGGLRRQVAKGGRVGLHQHYYGENTFLPAFLAVQNIQSGQAQVMRFLDDMGVDPRMMIHGLATPPQSIYLLSPVELSDYKLVTAE